MCYQGAIKALLRRYYVRCLSAVVGGPTVLAEKSDVLMRRVICEHKSLPYLLQEPLAINLNFRYKHRSVSCRDSLRRKYLRIRQNTSAYVSIRQHTLQAPQRRLPRLPPLHIPVYTL